MPAPTISHTTSAYASLISTGTRAFGQVTVATGDRCAITFLTSDSSSAEASAVASSGTAVMSSWTRSQNAGAANHCGTSLFTASVTTGGTLTATVSFTGNASAAFGSGHLYVATGSGGFGVTGVSASARQLSLAISAHSAVVTAVGDWAASATNAVTYTPSGAVEDEGTTDGVTHQSSAGAQFSAMVSRWGDTSAGTVVYGVNTPTTGTYTLVAVEFLAGSGGSPTLPLPVRQRRVYLPSQRKWARGSVYNLVPAQVPIPVKVADQTSQAARRRQFMLARRGRTSFPVVPPQIPVPPRKPDDPTQRRAVRGWLRIKGRYADPPWGQTPVAPNPPIVLNPSQRKTVRGWLRVKGRYVDPPWPQERAADTAQQRKTVRGWLRVKGRYMDPPWPPPAAPPNPAITFNPSQRRVLRGWPQLRGRTVTPVPPQVPVPPRKPDDPTQRRSLRGWLRIRPKHWSPPWPQATQPAPVDIIVHLGEPVDRWFTAQTVDRWFSGDTVRRWLAQEAQSRWIISRPAGGLTMAQTISTASLEYVRVPVSVTKSGAAYNPTGDTVQMAFVSSARSPNASDTWYSGTWETAGSTYYALCLVGPAGTVTLAAGTWYVWVKVTDAPEIPALPAGIIVVQ